MIFQKIYFELYVYLRHSIFPIRVPITGTFFVICWSFSRLLRSFIVIVFKWWIFSERSSILPTHAHTPIHTSFLHLHVSISLAVFAISFVPAPITVATRLCNCVEHLNSTDLPFHRNDRFSLEFWCECIRSIVTPNCCQILYV